MIDAIGINRELDKFMYDILVTTGWGLIFLVVAGLFIWAVATIGKDYEDNDWS
jgi:hypothetical protein